MKLKEKIHYQPPEKKSNPLQNVHRLEDLLELCQKNKHHTSQQIFAKEMTHLISVNHSLYDQNKLYIQDNPNPHANYLEYFEKTIPNQKDHSISGLKKKIDFTVALQEQYINRLLNKLPLKIAKHLYASEFFYTQKEKDRYQKELQEHLDKIEEYRQIIINNLNEKIKTAFQEHKKIRNKKNNYQIDKAFLNKIRKEFNIKNIQPQQLKGILSSPKKITEFITQQTKNHINTDGLLAEIFLSFAIFRLNYQTQNHGHEQTNISYTPATLKLDHNKIDAFLNTKITTIPNTDNNINQIKSAFFQKNKIFDSRLFKYYSFKQNQKDNTVTIYHHLPIQLTTTSRPHPHKYQGIHQHNGILINLSLQDTQRLLEDEQTLVKKYILKKIFQQIDLQSNHEHLQDFTKSKYGHQIPSIRHLIPHNTQWILNTDLAKETTKLPKTIINENLIKN